VFVVEWQKKKKRALPAQTTFFSVLYSHGNMGCSVSMVEAVTIEVAVNWHVASK
jgi:hypothetical protein